MELSRGEGEEEVRRRSSAEVELNVIPLGNLSHRVLTGAINKFY